MDALSDSMCSGFSDRVSQYYREKGSIASEDRSIPRRTSWLRSNKVYVPEL